MSNWNNFSIDKLSGAETFRELSTSGLYFIDMKKLFQKQMNKHVNKRRRIFFAILIATVSLVGVFGFVRISKEKHEYVAEPVESLLQADESDKSKVRVVETYGTKYDAAINKVEDSDPTKWDKEMLDKAYLSLLYADKIGAFTQAYTILSLLELAQNNGLNIDDNSYGITKEKRNDIKKRADVYARQIEDNAKGARE